ncbi:MAG: hypothetical protein ACREOG_10220 [Gemmatimonadaceae bacterium]
MPEAVMSPLRAWESFYVIVGTSAAALTGLQFVVMALVAEMEAPSSTQTIAAFGTPNIVHFAAVLLISAILSAPWPSILGPAITLSICGVAGVVYGVIVVRRARRQTDYKPVFEDWLWHGILPLFAYSFLLLAAATIARRPTFMLFEIGAVALLLLFIGIHNAWDTVTYITVDRRQMAKAEADREAAERSVQAESPTLPV